MFTTGFLVYVDFWLRNYNAYPARWVGGFAALSGVYALFATMAWTNSKSLSEKFIGSRPVSQIKFTIQIQRIEKSTRTKLMGF